jgi:Mlc titration factor MtfA (ptsG expression regulator)
MLHFLRDKRRQKLAAQPIPESWEDIIDVNVPHSRLLDDVDWEKLLRKTQVLMAEKRFEGCGGLEVTDEMRLTICAWGALVILELEDNDYYPDLNTILVYPEGFFAKVRKPLADGVVLEEEEARIGESMEGGPGSLTVTWDEVIRCAKLEVPDGVNVAIHEFTHQLDAEDGELNGVPAIANAEVRDAWQRVFKSEYEKLCALVDAGDEESSLLDPYAANAPSEFFAVAMETFFELSEDMAAEHPELYQVMSAWLGQDPVARWKRYDAERGE